MAVTWNYVRVVRDEDDFTLGISMIREEAKSILQRMPISDREETEPYGELYRALHSAAYSDKRRDNSEGKE